MRDLFLPPYAGELVYSALARRQALLGLSSWRTMHDAFGSMRFVHALFPSRLGTLASRLPGGSGLTLQLLLQDGTALPYLGPFMREEFHAAALDVLATGQRHGRPCRIVEFRGGVMRAARRTLAYCPACSRDDLERRGLPAWRTAHQLPGVYLCPWHDEPLRQTEHPIASTRAFSMCPDGATRGEPVACPLPPRVARAVARDTVALLAGDSAPVGVSNLKRALRSAMAEAGWLRRSGTAERGLREAFERHYGPAVLRDIGCELPPPNTRVDWFYRLYEQSNHQAPTPLRCILFCDFLGVPIRDVLDLARAPEVPSGVRRPDGGAAAAAEPEVRCARTRLLRSREKVARAIAENPAASRSDLRRWLAPAACQYLCRHDRAWYEARAPRPRRPGTAKTDWPARDAALARSVAPAAARLRLRPGRPERITRFALLQEIGFSSCAVGHIRDKLPSVLREIDSQTEDTRAIATRRKAWAMAEFLAAGRYPTKAAFRDFAKVPWGCMPGGEEWRAFVDRAEQDASMRQATAASDTALAAMPAIGRDKRQRRW